MAATGPGLKLYATGEKARLLLFVRDNGRCPAAEFLKDTPRHLRRRFSRAFGTLVQNGLADVASIRLFKPMTGDGSGLWCWKEHDHRLFAFRGRNNGDRPQFVLLSGWVKDKDYGVSGSNEERNQIARAMALRDSCCALPDSVWQLSDEAGAELIGPPVEAPTEPGYVLEVNPILHPAVVDSYARRVESLLGGTIRAATTEDLDREKAEREETETMGQPQPSMTQTETLLEQFMDPDPSNPPPAEPTPDLPPAPERKPGDTVCLTELAKLAGISDKTLWHWVARTHKLPAPEKVKGVYAWKWEEVDAVVARIHEIAKDSPSKALRDAAAPPSAAVMPVASVSPVLPPFALARPVLPPPPPPCRPAPMLTSDSIEAMLGPQFGPGKTALAAPTRQRLLKLAEEVVDGKRMVSEFTDAVERYRQEIERLEMELRRLRGE